MATFKSIKDLEKKVLSDIRKKFDEERSKSKIREVNIKNVEKEVYAAYTPKRDSRRMENGGLIAPENINVIPSQKSNKVVVNISNNTPPVGFDKVGYNSEFLAPIVEYGTGGDLAWQQPRPFMEATEDDLRNNELLKNIIREIDYIK